MWPGAAPTPGLVVCNMIAKQQGLCVQHQATVHALAAHLQAAQQQHTYGGVLRTAGTYKLPSGHALAGRAKQLSSSTPVAGCCTQQAHKLTAIQGERVHGSRDAVEACVDAEVVGAARIQIIGIHLHVHMTRCAVDDCCLLDKCCKCRWSMGQTFKRDKHQRWSMGQIFNRDKH
eukprot:1138933-Pelagomonas_calceolata.AAC.5